MDPRFDVIDRHLDEFDDPFGVVEKKLDQVLEQ